MSIDTETNAEDCRDGRGFGMGISFAGGPSFEDYDGTIFGVYLPFRHSNAFGLSANLPEEIRLDVVETLESYTGAIIFHNAKFDLVALETLGIKWTGKFYDTMLMCHLINENLPYALDLTSCCKYYIDGTVSKKDTPEFKHFVKTFGWQDVPSFFMGEYASWDAVITFALFNAIWDLFLQEVPEEYWQHKQDFLRVIIKMESRGVRINLDLCREQEAIGAKIMQEKVDSLGGNLGSVTFLGRLINGQLGIPVYKVSPKTGKASFDKDAMEVYDEALSRLESDIAKDILTYRGWQKAVTAYYRPYQVRISPDGRLRPNYKLHGTKTGRMSCAEPNLQQIPRVSDKPWNGHLKSAFIPAPGYTLYEFDYSQLELRLGTAYAKEENLISVFKEDRDIFSEMAPTLGLSRQDTKTFVYATQYFAGIKRLAILLGISMAKAEEIRDNYRDGYPGFLQMSQKAMALCKKNKKIKLWSGRYRHFQYPQDEAHKAFNSVIQGGAADIVEHVMVRLFKEIDDDDKCRMLLQVHDSVVFEIRNDCIEEYVPRIQELMGDVQPDFGVKFKVEGKIWGQAA